MKIETLKDTDLFSLDVDAFAHGVNCQGVMGSGVALQMRHKYAGLFAAYQDYIKDCKKNNLPVLGSVFAYWDMEVGIYNLFTQDKYGRDPEVQYATLDACNSAFTQMFINAQSDGISTIGMPQIGAGYGNLKWDNVLTELIVAAQKSTWDGVVCVAIR